MQVSLTAGQGELQGLLHTGPNLGSCYSLTYRKDLDRRLSSVGVEDGSRPTATKMPVRALCSLDSLQSESQAIYTAHIYTGHHDTSTDQTASFIPLQFTPSEKHFPRRFSNQDINVLNCSDREHTHTCFCGLFSPCPLCCPHLLLSGERSDFRPDREASAR